MPIIGEKMKGIKVALALPALLVVLSMLGGLASAQSMTTERFVSHSVYSSIYIYGDEGIFMGVGFMICGVISLLIGILLAIWAYSDAKKNCDENPIIWFLVVFFLGLIGLIIYLVVRKNKCQQNYAYQAPPPPPPM